jgi:hypothetical protein
MPCELSHYVSHYEWVVIRPMPPNRPRGIPCADDRRILNGIFWIFHSGVPRHDLSRQVWLPFHDIKRSSAKKSGWTMNSALAGAVSTASWGEGFKYVAHLHLGAIATL